jgi:hypothetical protein
MSTITAILEPDADGILHLPLPVELHGGKIRIVASVTAVPPDENSPRTSPKAAREWLKTARGSVRLEPGESAEAARSACYERKYGAKP